MADNLTIPVATNEIGGFHYQKMKIVDGNNASTTALAVDATYGAAVDVKRQPGNAGDIAHDTADSGNPVKIGAKAKSALSGLTLVAANDRTDLFADLDGVLVTRLDAPLGDSVSGNATNTDGTSTQCIAAQGSGVKTVLTDITLCNTSASAITVDIKDGSTTKWTFPVPAGGGVVFSWRRGLVGTANTAWNFDPSAAASTVTCSMSGFITKG